MAPRPSPQETFATTPYPAELSEVQAAGERGQSYPVISSSTAKTITITHFLMPPSQPLPGRLN